MESDSVLAKMPLPSPLRLIFSLTSKKIFPAFPFPDVWAVIFPPLLKVKLGVVIIKFPASPVPSARVKRLLVTVSSSILLVPKTSIDSVALILIIPPLPLSLLA